MAHWAAAIALAFNPSMPPEHVARVEEAAAEMRAYGRERIAASRAEPGDDLVTRLVEAEVDGHRLSDDDVIAMITGFVFAGAETTRRQLTAAVLLLAEHPDDWERLAAEPELVPNAVEEILRHRGIISGLTRRAEEPFERDDLRVPEGGRLLLSFDTANRDPDRFEDADAFVLDRPDAHAHVTFGWGPHLCVGAGLARLELAEGLGVLTPRFGPPTVEAVGPEHRHRRARLAAGPLPAPRRLTVSAARRGPSAGVRARSRAVRRLVAATPCRRSAGCRGRRGFVRRGRPVSGAR